MNIRIQIRTDWYQQTFDQEKELITSERSEVEAELGRMLDYIFEEEDARKEKLRRRH